MRRAICGLLLFAGSAGAAMGGGGVLTVTSVEPAGHALAAPRNTAIIVHFDRPLMTASADAASFSAFGRWSGAVSGSYGFSDSDQTVTLTPDRSFSAGEQVMVVATLRAPGRERRRRLR